MAMAKHVRQSGCVVSINDGSGCRCSEPVRWPAESRRLGLSNHAVGVPFMKLWLPLLIAFTTLSPALAQEVKRDIPYASPAAERQVLDVYAPKGAKDLPVVFWIHGGGWQTGDK